MRSRPHGLTEPGGDAVGRLLEAKELGAQSQIGAELAGVVPKDRLQPVLRDGRAGVAGEIDDRRSQRARLAPLFPLFLESRGSEIALS